MLQTSGIPEKKRWSIERRRSRPRRQWGQARSDKRNFPLRRRRRRLKLRTCSPRSVLQRRSLRRNSETATFVLRRRLRSLAGSLFVGAVSARARERVCLCACVGTINGDQLDRGGRDFIYICYFWKIFYHFLIFF